MCGILVIFNSEKKKKQLLKPLMRRGPDEKGTFINDDIYMGHTRLSIVNPESGPQPIKYKNWVMVINGELYNAKPRFNETDCHMLIKLINKNGPIALQRLDGIFSFVAYHIPTKRVIIARDPIGVTPLYYSEKIVSSLLTCIEEGTAKPVPPGHVADFTLGEVPTFQKWTKDYTFEKGPVPNITDLMTNAVSKRLMGDVPWGVLLSGGLDSTIVAALAQRLADVKRPDYPIVHSFCIGLRDSPDVAVAEKVAKQLGTHHTSIRYTVPEGIKAIKNVIKAIETYDVTTIRASVPMWLLGKALKKRGIKMVLSGEGSDELFAGYLYNLYCPSEKAMEEECIRKLDQLWAYDCLRANKTMADWGIETRVPFLDNKVVDFAMNKMPAVDKMSGTHPDGAKVEKWWLREQFRDIVPDYVCDRTKAQFSDAVGSKWIDVLKKVADKKISDELFATASEKYPYQTPDTKEAFWYRSIFEECFSHIEDGEKTVLYQPSIACSTGVAAEWHENFKKYLDPSGDAIHEAFNVS